jgi:hypothetical protein
MVTDPLKQSGYLIAADNGNYWDKEIRNKSQLKNLPTEFTVLVTKPHTALSA